MKNRFKLGGAKDLVLDGLDYIIPFKKHKGETIKEVSDYDPSYILWMNENGLISPNDELTDLIVTLQKEEYELNKKIEEERLKGQEDANEWAKIFDTK